LEQIVYHDALLPGRADAMPEIPGTAELFDPVHVLKPGSQPSKVLAASAATHSLSGEPRRWFALRDGTIGTWWLIVVGLLSWLG
jgi:hypothetical protein